MIPVICLFIILIVLALINFMPMFCRTSHQKNCQYNRSRLECDLYAEFIDPKHCDRCKIYEPKIRTFKKIQ